MMLFKNQIVTLLLAVAATSTSAFGPATPVNVGSNNAQSMTMRVSVGDMKRRSKITTLLDKAVVPGNPTATRQAIETTVVTPQTSNLLTKMNWKPRNAMIRKVRTLANAHNVMVASDFGIPMPRLEREAMEAAQATTRRAERKAHFDRINQERDTRVASRMAAESGSEKELKKRLAIRETLHAQMIEKMEAREKAKEAEAVMKHNAMIANQQELAQAELEAEIEATLQKEGKAAAKKEAEEQKEQQDA